jgi:hypothetical protein
MNRSTPSSIAPLAAVLAVALSAAACDSGDKRIEITETRKLDAPRPEQREAASTRMRFAPPSMGASGAPHGDMSGASAGALSLANDLPAGWKEVPPTPLRTANFVVPGHDGLECYVTVLPGGGGGVAANLNRWRKQMGLAAMSDADVAALPRVKVLGVDAPFVEMDGTFTGAGGAAPLPGYTMAAAAMERAGTAYFVKLIGPSADVKSQLGGFRALCASLRDAAPSASAAAESDEEAAPFMWTAPEGWTKGPPKQMRVVTFNPKDAEGVECYVAVLSGSAGGLAANVNRWRGQLSLPPLSADAVNALPTVPVFGRESHMVEIEAGDSAMYGVMCELPATSVFVKMIGPTAALRAERDRFIEFCKSLKMGSPR